MSQYLYDAGNLLRAVIKAESMVWAKTGQCEISVPLEITGQFAEICGASASTWCAECKKELCSKHAVKVGMETYCDFCGDEAEAAMAPLLQNWKVGQA